MGALKRAADDLRRLTEKYGHGVEEVYAPNRKDQGGDLPAGQADRR